MITDTSSLLTDLSANLFSGWVESWEVLLREWSNELTIDEQLRRLRHGRKTLSRVELVNCIQKTRLNESR